MRSGEDLTERELREAEEAIGYRFRDRELLRLALTHKSYSNAFGGGNNERLEFLGDAVLQLLVSEELYRRHPSAEEGELTSLRQRLVSAAALERVQERAGLKRFLRYSGGESNLGGKTTSSIPEAVLAALWLDGGREAAEGFLGRFLELTETPNYRSLLQEYVQDYEKRTPSYRTREGGEGYVCIVSALGEEAEGAGASKRAAETEAARKLLEKLKARTRH